MSNKRNYAEVRLRGVSPQLLEALVNISKNLGVSLTDMLKPKLREIADSYPDKLKQPPLDY